MFKNHNPTTLKMGAKKYHISQGIVDLSQIRLLVANNVYSLELHNQLTLWVMGQSVVFDSFIYMQVKIHSTSLFFCMTLSSFRQEKEAQHREEKPLLVDTRPLKTKQILCRVNGYHSTTGNPQIAIFFLIKEGYFRVG